MQLENERKENVKELADVLDKVEAGVEGRKNNEIVPLATSLVKQIEILLNDGAKFTLAINKPSYIGIDANGKGIQINYDGMKLLLANDKINDIKQIDDKSSTSEK